MNKPTDDKQFEVMVRDCAEIKYLQFFTLLGRKGQNQYGGDVASQDWKTIIQCKCYNQNRGQASYNDLITQIKGTIEKKGDYEKACAHYQGMNLFVVATTLNRDLPTQEAIQQISGDIPIQTLFWDDLAPLYEQFEEKYKLKEIRLTLDEALIRDRDNHPSFRLMKVDKLDKRLIPTYEAQEFEPRTEQDGVISPVWSRIRETWKDDRNRSVIIQGAGGIGKTVALFTIPRAKPDYAPPPAIYIPMYRLVDEKGNCLTISAYFEDKFSAINSALDHVTKRTWEEGPGLLLLLDGFNEVPSDKRRTVLRNINDWRKDHPGAQIIVVSRPMDNIDLVHELAGEPLPPLKLKPLDEKQARGFLSDRGLVIPAAGPIWKILTYPLFLVLYAKTGCLPRTTGSGYPLDVRKAMSGGALIWNYLQRELLRDDREDQETWVIRCAVACEYILPVIAYEMVRSHQFSIQRTELFDLIEETVKTMNLEALPNHLQALFDTYENHHPRSYPDLDSFQWIEVVLRETGFLLEHQKHQINGRRGREEKRYGFLHQNFRDCLAGLYLVNQTEMAAEDELPEVWMQSPSHLALPYATELMGADTADRLWEVNRKDQQYGEPGYEKNHTATCTLLELQKMRKPLPTALDFSGMDLRGLSLTRYLGKGEINLKLFRESRLTRSTKLDWRTFQSEGHTAPVNCVAVLPDGRVVSGSSDNTLRVWDTDTGQCLQTLEGHTELVSCVAVLSDGRVVSGSFDHTLKVWDPATGQCLQTLEGHSKPVDCVATLSDGQVVSGSRDSTLRVWDPSTGQCLQTLEETYEVNYVGVLLDGRVVSCSRGLALRIWDIATGQCFQHSWSPKYDGVCIAVLPSGGVFISSWGNTLAILDITTGKCLQTLNGHTADVECVTVMPDLRVVTGSRDSTLRVWDIFTGKCLHILGGHTSINKSVAIPQNSHLNSGLGNGAQHVGDAAFCQRIITLSVYKSHNNHVTVLPNGQVITDSHGNSLRVWDAVTGQCLQTLKGHTAGISCVDIFQNGQVISGSQDHTLRLWNAGTGQCLLTLEGHTEAVNCVAILSDRRVVSGSSDRTLRVWDAFTGECLKTFKGHKREVNCVVILPDGRVVSGSADCTLRIWDAALGECLQTLEGHRWPITCVAVLPDGRVVSGSSDHTLRVWDANTGQCLQTLEGHKWEVNCVITLSDGRVVSGSWDSTLRVWDAATGQCLNTMKGHKKQVNCLAVLSNGRIVSGSWDNTIRIWDADTGQYLQTLEGHTDLVSCVAVLNDGQLVSSSYDETLRIWDPDNGECLDTLEGTEIDVSMMNVSDAIVTYDLARLLWQNGAKISDTDYERYVAPFRKQYKQDH